MVRAAGGLLRQAPRAWGATSWSALAPALDETGAPPGSPVPLGMTGYGAALVGAAVGASGDAVALRHRVAGTATTGRSPQWSADPRPDRTLAMAEPRPPRPLAVRLAGSRLRLALGPSLALALVTAGCGSSCGGSEAPAEPPATPETSSPPVGVVEGVVRLAEGAELPARPAPAPEVGRPPLPDGCAPPGPSDERPVALGPGRGLTPVLVSAAGFSREMLIEPQLRQLAIRDCRLVPTFLAATRGDTLQVANETDHPFLPRLGSSSFMELLNGGQTRTFPLEEGGVTEVSCGFSTACGRSEVVVLYHPVFAVTGEGGRFRIEAFPASEDVQLHAWHPLFEETSTSVRVEAGQTVAVELTLRPRPPAPPATPEPPPTSPAPAGAQGEGDEAQPALY